MHNDRELMQLALYALEYIHTETTEDEDELIRGAIKSFRARLAQPEQTPVAWTVRGLITDFSRDFSAYQTKTYTVPLYTAPPQLEWQGLTDEDIKTMWDNHIIPVFNKNGINPFVFARAIEAKLKEKN